MCNYRYINTSWIIVNDSVETRIPETARLQNQSQTNLAGDLEIGSQIALKWNMASLVPLRWPKTRL